MADYSRSKLREKWSQDITARGFTCVPNLLLENLGHLGLTSSETLLIIMIEKFRWEADKMPYPSIDELARLLGCRPRSITRLLESIEEKGLIRRRYKRNATTRYDISRLILELQSLAETKSGRHFSQVDEDIFGLQGGQ